MAVVVAGSRVLLRTAKGVRALRTLQDVAVDPESGTWPGSSRSSRDVAALALGPGTADLPTPDGILQVQVIIEGQGGGLACAPSAPPASRCCSAAATSAARSPSRCAAALLPDGPLTTRPAPLTGDGAGRATSRGRRSTPPAAASRHTSRASSLDAASATARPAAGARCASARGSTWSSTCPTAAARSAAVAVVVLQRGALLRVRFHDIAPADRERLVRLVFARHRDDLRERRKALDEARDRRVEHGRRAQGPSYGAASTSAAARTSAALSGAGRPSGSVERRPRGRSGRRGRARRPSAAPARCCRRGRAPATAPAARRGAARRRRRPRSRRRPRVVVDRPPPAPAAPQSRRGQPRNATARRPSTARRPRRRRAPAAAPASSAAPSSCQFTDAASGSTCHAATAACRAAASGAAHAPVVTPTSTSGPTARPRR